MNLSDDQIRALLQAVSSTRDQELTCDECLCELGGFAELTLKGLPVEEAYDLVQQHLQVCGECHEEFALLLKALEGLEEPCRELQTRWSFLLRMSSRIHRGHYDGSWDDRMRPSFFRRLRTVSIGNGSSDSSLQGIGRQGGSGPNRHLVERFPREVWHGGIIRGVAHWEQDERPLVLCSAKDL